MREKATEKKIYDEFDHYIIPPIMKERVQDPKEYKEFYENTVKDKAAIEKYWEQWANQLPWFRKWDQVLDDSNPPFFRWFVGAETNLAHLCLDWQIEQGRKNKIALIWEGEPYDKTRRRPMELRKFTYYDLYRRSNRIAYALKEKLGVKKGEILTFYMPMLPELIHYMLATQRLGAAHSIVYSGFSALSLAERVMASGSRIIVAADALYRRQKVVRLKEIVDEAIEICKENGHKVEHVIVYKRTERTDIPWNERRDIWHHEFLHYISENVRVETQRLNSNDISYLLYTSGTTGAPKGVQHGINGYAVGAYATMKLVFDIKEDDIYWCIADVGWVTGHSYVLYGPLMTGATVLIYEGAPDTPRPDRWWHMIERYGVTTFYTSPTAVRMAMKFPEDIIKEHDLSTLRIIHCVGEPLNPEAFRWTFKNLGKQNVISSSTWWMTETGHILTGHFPNLGKIFPLKPGTNGYPIPGVKLEVFNEDGKTTKPGKKGYLVITTPWPGMAMTLYQDPQRYVDTYWSKFSKKKENKWYFYPGDFAVKDQDGYLWILGRADDILKISGHRIGTAELESAMVMHPAVAEAACIGRPDEVKGEVPFVFTVLKQGFIPSSDFEKELKNHLRKTIGPIVASDVSIIFVDMVPKTRSGKIMRRVLRAVISEQELGDISTLEDEAAVDEAQMAYDYLKAVLEKGGTQ
jgi:acetyl-CoA synthetase